MPSSIGSVSQTKPSKFSLDFFLPSSGIENYFFILTKRTNTGKQY
jgi:hypothetical protein